MNRIAHRIQPNTARTMPQSMVFVDTETVYKRTSARITTHTLRLGASCYWRRRRDGKPDTLEWLDFDAASDFWTWLLQRCHGNAVTYLVSHNLAFDFLVLDGFRSLTTAGWRLVFLYEKGSTRLIRYGQPTPLFADFVADGGPVEQYHGRRWRKTLLCLDNVNLFAGPLAKWGKRLGSEKTTMPGPEAVRPNWAAYCRRDVEILLATWQWWIQFLQDNDLGSWRPTIGSQAFGTWKHRFMSHPVYIHTEEAATRLERLAYHGGRVEPFYVGQVRDEALYKLDVNSMYPFVMRNNLYPHRLKSYHQELTVETLAWHLARCGCVARVTVNAPEPVFPAYVDKRLCYPVGIFDAHLCTPELRYAVERGWILQVHECAFYYQRSHFRRFVDYFYQLRQGCADRGDELGATLCKRLLNSLYGKFGQRSMADRVIGTAPLDAYRMEYCLDQDSGERFTRLTAGGHVIETRPAGEGWDAFCAIAAHITAYARMYLWSLITTAGRDTVYYADTDSLIVDKLGYDRLHEQIDPERLGALKLEGVDPNAVFFGPKDYRFGGELRRKGIPLQAVQVGPAAFELTTWPGLHTALETGKVGSYQNVHVVRNLSYHVNWGEPQPNGWIAPFVLGE